MRVTDVHLLVPKVRIVAMRYAQKLEQTQIVRVVVTLVEKEQNAAIKCVLLLELTQTVRIVAMLVPKVRVVVMMYAQKLEPTQIVRVVVMLAQTENVVRECAKKHKPTMKIVAIAKMYVIQQKVKNVLLEYVLLVIHLVLDLMYVVI
jgi:hypothetical protein